MSLIIFHVTWLSLSLSLSLCWSLRIHLLTLNPGSFLTKTIQVLPQQFRFPPIVFKHQTVLTEFNVKRSLSSTEPVSIERGTSVRPLSPMSDDELDWLDREAYWLSAELCKWRWVSGAGWHGNGSVWKTSSLSVSSSVRCSRLR